MTFEVFDDEVSGATSAVYVGRYVVVSDNIKESKPLDFSRGLVPLPASAFEHVRLHYLAVVAPELSEVEQLLGWHGRRITADAAGVDGMVFL